MGREFELKYAATPEILAVLAEKFPGLASISMETAYYDTPGGALGKLHWTLRRRMENGRSVCTVKTPLPGRGRGEWETECAAIADAVPILCALGAPAELVNLTAGGLTEVCAARFTRLAAKAALPECTVELALDKGFLLGGGKELPFTEVEVELKEGTEEAAVVFAQKLAQEYSLTPEPASKYKRALSLTQIGRAHV